MRVRTFMAEARKVEGFLSVMSIATINTRTLCEKMAYGVIAAEIAQIFERCVNPAVRGALSPWCDHVRHYVGLFSACNECSSPSI